MTTPTVPVTVTMTSEDGPHVGVTVRARLDTNEVYGGVIVSETVQGVTDALGVAVLNLFPNAPAPTGLGTQGSTYRVFALIPDGRSLNVFARVPNLACRLEDILVPEDLPPLDAADAVLLQIQSSAATATNKAAEASATAAAIGDLNTALVQAGANAAGASASAASASSSAAASSTAKTAAEAARDAALIQAGVYATSGAGLAGVADGQYFKVVGGGDVAAFEYKKTPSANLFNTATVRADRFINSATGQIGTLAGWGCSAFIPVTPGQQYTISGTRGRQGVAFYSSATDTAFVAGSYDGTATLPLTVTAPVGATHMAINLYQASAGTYTNVQVEAAATPTTYSPFGVSYAALAASYPSLAALSAVGVDVSSLEALTVTQVSVNLLNTALVRAGFFVNSASGNINALAGWGCSSFIPVVAGQQYTISGTRGRHGLAFFSAAADGAAVAGSYDGTTTLPLTVTAPAGATHLVVNLYSATAPTYTNVQVENGPEATRFIAFGGSLMSIDKGKVYPAVGEFEGVDTRAALVLDSDGTSYVRAYAGTDYFEMCVVPFAAGSHDASKVFNFGSHKINGVEYKSADDDVAPYRVFGTTIGANHGYAKTDCTVAGHGKTQVDVGSVWTSGGVQWVLAEVPDANTLTITARASNNAFTAGTLTHVSGAAHATSFTPSAVAQAQWYPVIKNRSLTVSVDGSPLTVSDGTWKFSKNVTFAETYEVMNKSSIVEWLITQVGTATDLASYSGTSDLSVSMAYVFDTCGGCTIFSDFLALNAVPAFQDIMFTQCYKFTAGVDGAVKYYVPKALPFTHESVSYDFAKIVDMTGFAPVTRADFTPARCDASGQLADRAVMLNNSVGLAVGYLPVQDADPAVRRIRATTKALQISEIAKVYMSCVDTTSKTSLSAGDYYSAVAYRVPFRRPASRTASYVVRTPGAAYLYCDWHATVVDRVPLPPDLHGKAYTLVEKSANVAILSAAATSSVVFGVTAAGSYGYAVLRFA